MLLFDAYFSAGVQPQSGNLHFYDRSAPFPWAYCHFPAAHHFKALPDIFQGDMRLAVIGGIIAASGVGNRYFASGFGFTFAK